MHLVLIICYQKFKRQFIIFESAMQNSLEQDNKPIPLIQFQGEKFTITEQAINFLKSIENPFGVITIVGKYRTGKSLFLNKVILNNNNSFRVCPTINSCTKGLWISKQIIKSQHPEAPDMDIIVIDTEGFGAIEQTDAYNNRILLFALLLSSYFIYNSVGSIDQKSLNNLNVITNLAKELQSKNLSNDKIEEQFPSFMWIVRDFTLRLVDSNGCQIQSKEYLQCALQNLKGVSDAIEQKNKIRRMIKHFFKERDCFTLVTPVENQNDLQNLNSLPDSVLRPQFLQQIQVLRQRILRRVKPKRLKNRKLIGQTFVELAHSYIQAINNGSLPNIDSAWKSINNFEINQTLHKTKELISKKSQEFIETIKQEESFVELEKQLLEETYAFMKKKILNEADLEQQFNAVKMFIENNIVASKSKNKKKSLEVLFQKFHEKCDEFGYEDTGEQIEQKWIKLEKEFKEHYKENPSLKQFLLEHLYPLKFQSFTSMMCRQSDLIKLEQSEKKMMKETYEKKLKEAEELRKQVQNRLYDSQRDLNFAKTKSEQQLKVKSIQLTYIKKELNQLKQDVAKAESKCEHMSKEIKEKDMEISQLRMKISNLGLNLKELDDHRGYAMKELQILKQNFNYKIKEIEELKQINHQLRTQLEKRQDREHSIVSKNKMQIQNKSAEYESLMIKYQNLQREFSNCQQKIIKLESALDSQSMRINKEEKLYQTMLQTLRSNFQSERQHTIQLTEANKNMAYALKHLEQRFEQAQEKQKKLKQFKRCFKNSSCMQCQNCSKFFVPTIFPQHLNICIMGPESLKKLENEKQKIFTPTVEITVKQTLLKDSDSKPYTEYVIQIKKGSKSWIVNRKYKQFCDLHSQLKALLPGVHLSDCSYIVSPQQGTKKSLLVEQRRKILQKYLVDLASNPHIAQEPLWKTFIEDHEPQSIQSMVPESYNKLAISDLLRNSHNLINEYNSPQKQNHFDSNRQQHKTPQEFLRIWNERNLRAKEVSKTKKLKN